MKLIKDVDGLQEEENKDSYEHNSKQYQQSSTLSLIRTLGMVA